VARIGTLARIAADLDVGIAAAVGWAAEARAESDKVDAQKAVVKATSDVAAQVTKQTSI